jgi:hypothetical protein
MADFSGVMLHLDEGQRQMVLLALAKLSIERPGWLDAIEEIAAPMDNKNEHGKPELLHNFRALHAASTLPLALDESIRLQSHYARLLNMYDGGKRLEFSNSGEWIERLIKTGTIKP